LGNWVLDLNGGSTADGTSVRIWAPNKSTAQRFTFASASAVKTDTAFAIKSVLNPQLVMDIYGGSSDNRARLQIYNANNSQAQMFSFKQVGNGLYEIVNVNSGKPFEAQGGSVSNGERSPSTHLTVRARSIGLLLITAMASTRSLIQSPVKPLTFQVAMA